MFADIPVSRGSTAAPVTDFGHAPAILRELQHALTRLATGGEPTRIDLAALPFGPGDEARLLAVLGRGEVSATIDALGPTQVWETRFPGVWVLDYQDADGRRLGLQLEVDLVPAILRTPPADLTESAAALAAVLDALPDAQSGAQADPESGTPPVGAP